MALTVKGRHLFQKACNPYLGNEPIIDGDKRILMVASYDYIKFQIS